jgi:hypothetical protein
MLTTASPIAQIDEQFLWPPKCRLKIYKRRTKLLFSERDRRLDLSDTLMLEWPHHHRTVYMGVSTKSLRWKRWDERAVVRDGIGASTATA